MKTPYDPKLREASAENSLPELVDDTASCFKEYWYTPGPKTWEAKSEELKHLHTWLSATNWKITLLKNELDRSRRGET